MIRAQTLEKIDMAPEAMRSSVPIGVAATMPTWSHWSAADLVTIATLIYIVLQVLLLLWRWNKEIKETRSKRKKPRNFTARTRRVDTRRK